jgi:hypothetical protein
LERLWGGALREEVDGEALGAEGGNNFVAVVGVPCLQGEEHLDLVDAEVDAGAVVLDIQHVQSQAGNGIGDRGQGAGAVVEHDA